MAEISEAIAMIKKAESDADIFLLSSEKFFYRQVNPPEKRAFHPENLNPYVL